MVNKDFQTDHRQRSNQPLASQGECLMMPWLTITSGRRCLAQAAPALPPKIRV